MSRLELKVAPDVVWLAVAALMGLASAIVPGLAIAMILRIAVAVPIVAIGIALIVGARVLLDRARTTWHPSAPERTTSLVTTGVYRYSRNPMYLGMFLILVGWAVVLADPVALALSATFVLYIDRFQIVPEERALVTAVGDEYRAYADRVRRWL